MGVRAFKPQHVTAGRKVLNVENPDVTMAFQTLTGHVIKIDIGNPIEVSEARRRIHFNLQLAGLFKFRCIKD